MLLYQHNQFQLLKLFQDIRTNLHDKTYETWINSIISNIEEKETKEIGATIHIHL